MQFKLTAKLYILLITSLLLFNTGCNGVKSSEASFGSLNITPPPPPTPPLPPSAPDGSTNGAEDDEEYFYVAVKNDANDAVVHVHDATDFSKTCSVSKSSLAHEDIMCMIEVPEGDIYAKDLVLEYNIPREMCRYMVQETYWFYNREVGIGPETISVSADNSVNASGDITSTTYTCAFDGVVGDCATGHPEVAITGMTPGSQNIKCIYDDTTNCCIGDYTLLRTVLTNGASADVSTPVETSWGGNLKNCIGGPGKTNWSEYTVENIPAGELRFTRPGVKSTYTITAPSDLGLGGLDPETSSIHVANWYGDAADHTHDGFVSAASSTMPFFMAPIDDRDGTAIDPSNRSYNFICLDEAFEIKHRIRAFVREWDYYPDFKNYISSLGVIEFPDRATFGSMPDETDPTCLEGLQGFCNDSLDIDDFLNLVAPSRASLLTPFYDTTPPLDKRKEYFPLIQY